MIEECTGYTRSLTWGKIFSIAIVMILVLTISMPPGVAPRAHPVLFALARERPEARVGVVVQKQVADTSIEETVASLGGVITKDLRLINAFAADVPAHALPALASIAGVRWVSPDAPILEAQCSTCVDTSKLANAYIRAIGADQLWNKSPSFQGQDTTVAVVDSGLVDHSDIESRIIATAKFNSDVKAASDGYGHGTHVAGIIGGDGTRSSGTYIGVAPKVNLVSVKVGDNQGAGSTSDVVAGLQWIYETLLLQDEPSLTPDQVKYRLIATARPFESRDRAGAGSLDILAAVNGTTTESANTGVEASHLLQTGSDPMVWNSVNWGSVNWGSVNWGSVNWGSVNSGSLYWGD